MKRELAFALGVQSQLASPLGRTRSSQAQSQSTVELSHCNGGPQSEGVSNKRLKVSSLIVYTRRGKPKNGVSEDLKVEQLENSEELNLEAVPWDAQERETVVANGAIEGQCNGVSRKSMTEEELTIDEAGLVDVLVEEDLAPPCERAELCGELRVDSEEGLVDVVIREDSRRLGSFFSKGGGDAVFLGGSPGPSRRFTRSFVNEDEVAANGVGNEAPSNVDRGPHEMASPENLQLKMSGTKNVQNKKLQTVRDLFETGLLEGVTVVYMAGVNKAPGLRGTIMDGGILCSCSNCEGRRVIPPSQFEIHACKVYRRAAQYICLENGKSLLEVLKACRRAPVNLLEATVQRIIYSLPAEKTFTCRGCKGTFPPSSFARTGHFCSSCAELRKSQDSQSITIHSMEKKSRSANAVLTLDSPVSPVTSFSTQDNGQWMHKRRSKDEQLISKSPEIVSAYPRRAHLRLVAKSPEALLISKSSRSASPCISRKQKSRIKMMDKSWRSVPRMKLSKVASTSISSPRRTQWKITIKDQRLHRLVFDKDGLPDGTALAYYSRGQKLLEGYKQGFGIFCKCCNSEVSASQFEAHAGWSSRKKPYSNIYTSNGVSLHELAISLSKGRRYSAKDNDNLCTICADGGNLLLCDGCPRAFHRECASLTTIPRGDWYCHYCQNMFHREKFVNENALAAGRVSGVDPIEDISKRCIRIVRNIGTEISGCVLCGCYDFSKSGFGPRTIILCDQCEQEFHIGCLREHKMANLKELPKGKWFCSRDCNRIHSTLQNLVTRGAEKLQDSFLDNIKKKHEEKGLDMVDNLNVSWRLLSGSFASPESRRLLSEAVAIFHECFDPIVDWMSGRDLIPSMVYGRSTRGQEYGGMYCAVLIVNSVVVSAGIFRVFGRELAELPLVATSKENHNKGYFQLLFSCIEKLLAFLNVRSLVLPAAVEAESIWTNRFGFKRITAEELTKYKKMGCQMVTFQGTSMLKKPVPQYRLASNGEL
ncbi:uncharacterized protein LOC116207830 isoform X2 [Punica granatum]|uniref:Uncharacterized protein LOC116207830 isoform X2 n=1 Tax=Punica granatum TaxID=22663 RepID=A0A6P8DQX1_PUNGR|nr:uncharacterized protein LOC116207830 isoform X2 [Punica granatum]